MQLFATIYLKFVFPTAARVCGLFLHDKTEICNLGVDTVATVWYSNHASGGESNPAVVAESTLTNGSQSTGCITMRGTPARVGRAKYLVNCIVG